MDFHGEVEEFMDEFDFDKVHRVMEFMDWKWAESVCEGKYEIPSKAAIRKHARRLLTDAAKDAYNHNEPMSIGSGGFLVKADWDPAKNKIYLRLSFEIESWDNYD